MPSSPCTGSRFRPERPKAVGELLAKHGERLERDLLLYYGIELADVLLVEHAPRKLLNLISRLPVDSATRSVETWGEGYEGWTEDKQVQYLILEQLLFQRHDFISANSEKNKAPKPPKPLDLPLRKKTTKSSPFARMLAEAKAHEARS